MSTATKTLILIFITLVMGYISANISYCPGIDLTQDQGIEPFLGATSTFVSCRNVIILASIHAIIIFVFQVLVFVILKLFKIQNAYIYSIIIAIIFSLLMPKISSYILNLLTLG